MPEVSIPLPAETQNAYGTQVAPGTGTDIASIPATSLPPGNYLVETRVGFGATAEAAGVNLDNFQLMVGGVARGRAILNGANAANTGYNPSVTQVHLNGNQALSVRPVAAASGGTNYKASISATKVG